MKVKAVIFDLDGTLLDSLEDLSCFANEVLEQNGFAPLGLEQFKSIAGYGTKELFQKATDVNEDALLEKLARQYLYLYHTRPQRYSKLYEGIEQLLQDLHKLSIQKAILSNKPDGLTKKCVEDFVGGGRFDRVCGHMEGFAKKPNGESTRWLLSRLGVGPAEALFVGDTQTDMQTAAAAGIDAVGVSWGFRDEATLRSGGAKHIIHHPKELLGLL